jgi:hypothetical protein
MGSIVRAVKKENKFMERLPLHVLCYGETGSGKSTFAATFPKPMVVFCFDPMGKHLPYVKAGKAGKMLSYKIGEEITIPYVDIECPDGIIRVEFFHDLDIDTPTSFSAYRMRMAGLQNEPDWVTIVTDSVTFMELSARKLDEKILNPLPEGVSRYAKGGGHDARQWYGASTDALEEMLCIRYAGLDMNVVVIAHTNKKKVFSAGEQVQGAFAPGRLYERSLLSAAYQEQYRCYTDEGNYYVQTGNRNGYVGTTQIDAHDPSHAKYESLWYHWDKKGDE